MIQTITTTTTTMISVLVSSSSWTTVHDIDEEYNDDDNDAQNYDYAVHHSRNLKASGGQQVVTIIFGTLIIMVVTWLAYQGRYE